MSVETRRRGNSRFVLSVAAALALPAATHAITITGYSAAANDRFASGFPTTPVTNTDPSFVGKDYDWSSVAWSTTTYSPGFYKNFAMLSPQHFLTASHYASAAGVRVLGNDGVVYTQTPGTVSNLGVGLKLPSVYDLSVAKINTPISSPSKVDRAPVLDLHASSTSDSLANYQGLSVFLYGHSDVASGSPRVGVTTVDQVTINAGDPNQAYIRTLRTDVEVVSGDSGSPTFYGWTNPNGGKQLTLLALNSAIGPDPTPVYNYLSMLAFTNGMNAANNAMTPDGYALRVAGNPIATWVGNSSTTISANGAWGLSGSPGQTSDQYVAFNGATATSRSVSVSSNHSLRGLYFKSTAATNDDFTISGASTLTIGRGGITNYDNTRQTISAPIALGDHQYWDVGAGGVTAGAINTNGKLLEIAGTGTAILNGNVSGSGGVALSGSRLEMSGTSAYTGATWVHSGTLNVSGSIASSSAVKLESNTRLDGTGRVSVIQGAGSVNPGNSPGILTATSVNPSGGLDFAFELTQTGSPTYGNASASGNDVLRVTGVSPFSQALNASNQIAVYFNVASLQASTSFRGGIYLDTSTSFLAQIQNASFAYYIANPLGPVSYNGVNYSLYSGPLTIQVSTVANTADFGAGNVNGGVMQFAIVPEPASLSLLLGAGVFLIRRRAR